MKLKPTKPKYVDPTARARTLKPRGIRYNAEEEKQVQAMADKYTGGNFSEFVRYASLKFKPSKEDFQK